MQDNLARRAGQSRWLNRSALQLVTLALIASGCTASVAPPASGQPSTAPSASDTGQSTPRASGASARVDGWRADLEGLVPAMEALHPDLYHGTPRQDLEAAVDDILATVPAASDDELLVGVLHVAALVSAKGRDGHTGAYVWGGGEYPLHSLPLRLWLFSDGLYVVDALPPYEALIGQRVATVAGLPIAAVQAALDPLIPRDNAQTVTLLTPRFLLIPEVLHGLGLVAATDAVELGSIDDGGRQTATTVLAVAMAEYNAWAGAYGLDLPARPASGFLARMDEPLWWSDAQQPGVLYVQYNRVDGVSNTAVDELRAALAGPDLRRVVVDIRHNYGGETRAIRPVLDALEQAPARPLVLVTGRNTFSAAVLFAAELERVLDPAFVGEPMGGSPNFYANSRDIALAHAGITVSVSTEWYVGSSADDPRLEIEPSVAVEMSAADYFGDTDPALAAAIGTP